MNEKNQSPGKKELITRKYRKRGQFGEIFHRIKRNKGAMFGLILLCIIFLTFIASWFVSYESITTTNAYARYNPPSWQYPFGTDDMGRNLFLRVVYGARYSIVIGFGCTLISLVIGVGLGAAAGFYGGKLESIIMRAADVMISVPAILAAMVLMTALGQSLMNLIFAMGITGVPIYIRITRASVLSVRSNEYVEASGRSGCQISA